MSAEQQVTIEVNELDVIESLQHNITNQHTLADPIEIRIPGEPDGTVEGRKQVDERGNYYPPEMDPHPIHIDPRKFVEFVPDYYLGTQIDEFLSEVLEKPKREINNEDIEKYWQNWRFEAQKRLKDEIKLNGETVEIEYRSRS